MSNVNFRHFKVLIPLILISLAFIVAFNIFLERLNFDSQRKNAQFAILNSDISLLQELSGNDRSTMLAILKDQVGISTIIVPEYTIGEYERLSKITVLPGHQIINTLRVGQLYRTVLSRLRRKTTIDPHATYIIVDELKVYKRIISHLKLFLPRDSVVEHSGRIIQVNIPFEKVLTLPLGFSEDLIKPYTTFGFNIIPELKSFYTFSNAKIDYTFAELEKNELVKSVMFAKDFNFGDAEFSGNLLTNFQRSDYKLIVSEFLSSEYEQPRHLESLASKLSTEVVVLHGVLKKDDGSISLELLFNRYLRALNERSPHILTFAPVRSSHLSNLYDKNILYMKKVIETYERSGGINVDYFPNLIKIGASYMEKLIIGLGIFSALFLLILKVHRLDTPRQYGYLIGFLSIAYAIILGVQPLTVSLLGLMSVVLGPVIGFVYFYPNHYVISNGYSRRKLFTLFLFLLQAFFVCMVSVIFCIALYSDAVHLQNIVPFRGVKLGLLLPVVLVGLYFYCGDRRVNSIMYVLRRVVRFPMTFSAFFVLLFASFVILVYIFRSGNYSQLSSIESSFRLFLEQLFIVRPRFKEFLIGYPALLIGYWFADQKLKDMLWFLNGLGAIALASLINSFCHFHTPVLISLYRSVLGFVVGCFVALAVYYTYMITRRLIKSLRFIYH
tara:strand:+ start:6804 stop:8810 length:2007 start_codon:yes stop_codon:yes gene_type:complete